MFKRAVKHEARLRLAIAGPSGAGKTYTALSVATALGGSVAVVDTEHGSASKYADVFDFDVMEMAPPFHPDRFVQAIREAAAAGYTTIVLDSISHAWSGQGGLLELVEDAQRRMKTPNSWAAWREITPLQNRFVDGIVAAPLHVITTMRSKQEYVQEVDERTGRTSIRKVGMAPVQRDGFEYEFDVLLDMDVNNSAVVSKTRCPALSGRVFSKPGVELAGILLEWLRGAPAPSPTAVRPATTGTTNASTNGATTTNGSGAGATSAPPPPAAPPGELPPEVRQWEGPEDAYAWAVGIGASDNVFSARTAMKNVINAHGGRLTRENAPAVYVAYYHDRMARAQERARAEVGQPDQATSAEQAPE